MFESAPNDAYENKKNGKALLLTERTKIQLKLDLGEFGKKNVFAGIKKHYEPENLLNKMVICVNNLKPREMRFGTSEGMILAASNEESGVYLVSPDSEALPGMKVS